MKKQLNLSQKNTFDVNCFGIDKLHGFMMHCVILAVGRLLRENYYSFQLSNVGSYVVSVHDGP